MDAHAAAKFGTADETLENESKLRDLTEPGALYVYSRQNQYPPRRNRAFREIALSHPQTDSLKKST